MILTLQQSGISGIPQNDMKALGNAAITPVWGSLTNFSPDAIESKKKIQLLHPSLQPSLGQNTEVFGSVALYTLYT